MGSFSFLRADCSTHKANIIPYQQTIKVLIPQKFVGHYGTEFFLSRYLDYGEIEVEHQGKMIDFDLYGFIAYMNRDKEIDKSKHLLAELIKKNPRGTTVGDFYELENEGGWEDTKKHTNRLLGISLACYAKDHINCKYKMKLVNYNFFGKYEDCKSFSDGDPVQGFRTLFYDEMTKDSITGNKSVSVSEYISNYCVDNEV